MDNKDLTLYNAFYDPQTERTSYTRTHIFDVDWQANTLSNLTDRGINISTVISCFIPFLSDVKGGKTYLSPQEFRKLKSSDLDKYFTLDKGDYIVKGIVAFDFNNQQGGKLKDLQDLYEVGTIVNVITNDFGSPGLQHWEVNAK